MLKHKLNAVTEGCETWVCTTMRFHFMSGTLPLLKRYQSKMCNFQIVWGCSFSHMTSITIGVGLILIKPTGLRVYTAFQTNIVTPAAFRFTVDTHFVIWACLVLISCSTAIPITEWLFNGAASASIKPFWPHRSPSRTMPESKKVLVSVLIRAFLCQLYLGFDVSAKNNRITLSGMTWISNF